MEGEWKDCRNKNIGEFVVGLCLLGTSDAIPVVLPTLWSKCEMNKDDTKTMPKLDGEIPIVPNPTQRTTGKEVKLVSGEEVLTRK